MVNNQNRDQNTLLMPKEIMQSVNTGIIGDPITTNYKRKTEISHMSVDLAVWVYDLLQQLCISECRGLQQVQYMGGLWSRADISFFPSFGRQLVEAGAAQSQLQGIHPTPTWRADFFFFFKGKKGWSVWLHIYSFIKHARSCTFRCLTIRLRCSSEDQVVTG